VGATWFLITAPGGLHPRRGFTRTIGWISIRSNRATVEGRRRTGISRRITGLLPNALLPPPTRGGPSIDFGARSVEARATVVFTELYSERVAGIEPVPEPSMLVVWTLVFSSGLAGIGLAQRKRRLMAA